MVFRDDAAIERALAKSKLVQDIVSGVDSSCWSGRSQRPLFIHFSTSRSPVSCTSFHETVGLFHALVL